MTTVIYLGGQSTDLAPLDKHNFWYSFGIFSPHAYTWLPNTLLIITLISNFGTFLLYMTTCIVAIVAFREHHSFNGFKHMVIPVFGLLANLGCMLFYLVGPFIGRRHELARSHTSRWESPRSGASTGYFYFQQASKSQGQGNVADLKTANRLSQITGCLQSRCMRWPLLIQGGQPHLSLSGRRNRCRSQAQYATWN